MSKVDVLYNIKLHADILADNILEEGQYITYRDAQVIQDHINKALKRLDSARKR